MKIVIPGGTGQVGRTLCRAFRERGHNVVVLSRGGTTDARVAPWDGRTVGAWANEGMGSIQVRSRTAHRTAQRMK